MDDIEKVWKRWRHTTTNGGFHGKIKKIHKTLVLNGKTHPIIGIYPLRYGFSWEYILLTLGLDYEYIDGNIMGITIWIHMMRVYSRGLKSEQFS